MKRYWSLLTLIFGIFFVIAGFMYDVMFAGIPFQDPTPELEKQYAYHSHIASIICRIGFGSFFAGLFAGIIQSIVRRFRS